MSHKEDFLASCLILDTETTSKSYEEAQVIESGFVIRENNNWTMFQELHKPLEGIVPPAIEAICYITNEMVADCPTFDDSKEVFNTVVSGYEGGFLVAHNNFYDMKILERYGIMTSHYNWVCTWRLSKWLFNGDTEVEATNLPYLRFALDLDIPLELHCHRAGHDSLITGKLLEKLIEIMETRGIIDPTVPYGPQLLNLMQEPIIYKVWPFGKHQGDAVNDVPISYIQWALKNLDSLKEESESFDPDLAATIADTLEFRGII